MEGSVTVQRTVVLVGAGHAHLYLASRVEDFTRLGYRVVLIDPGNFWYSGMATGMLSGLYQPAEDQVDPRRLIEAHGGEFMQACVERVDTRARQLYLTHGESLGYDYLSLNIGSQVAIESIPGAMNNPTVWPVKPISNLYKLHEYVKGCSGSDNALRVAIIGGGPTGCEVAANLAALAERLGAIVAVNVDVSLIVAGDRLVKPFPSGAAQVLYGKLADAGITIFFNTRVKRCEGATLVTQAGETLKADIVIPATGLKANPLVHTMGLPSDENGLCVAATLHSTKDPRIFATGDCAALQGHQLPKLGVFGVREAPCIHHNLLASIKGKPLKNYRPQKRYLAILNLGDGTGLAVRGKLWWYGRASMWLKHFIDKRFMRGYQRS